MSLKLSYITNNPDIAAIADRYGVDRLWIDLEKNGKAERQHGTNSVLSDHSLEDIKKVRPVLNSAELLVRINPWYEGSAEEIEKAIDYGADIIMLPMWKSEYEIESFLKTVDNRVKTIPLLETKEAVDCADRVLEYDFDEIFIGLNDLYLSYGQTFIFEPLSDGTVDMLCTKFKKKGIPYGFGGLASLGKGMLKSEKIIMEHYRLGSTGAILSRSFCDINIYQDIEIIDRLFRENVHAIREYEKYCQRLDERSFMDNQIELKNDVISIGNELKRTKINEK